MRKKIPLNYDWDFIDHFDDSKALNESLFILKDKVSLPHTVKEVPFSHYDESIYEMKSLYHKKISKPEFYSSEHAFLQFYGVMTNATVYINQEEIGRHEGGYTPFRFDITNYLLNDTFDEIDLYVIVDSNEVNDVPPFGNVVDYLGYGGIYREVEILIFPEYYISDVAIKTREAIAIQDDSMTLDFRVEFNSENIKNSKLLIEIYDDQKKIFGHSYHDTGSFITRQETHQPIIRWDTENPHLYNFKAKLYSKNTLIDEVVIPFGYREAKFTPEGFFLNNKPLKLVGLNRHQSYPYVGYAMPKRIQESDASFLKNVLGCNIVRTSHYMQSDHFINKCDEIGLLVFEEIPGWQYIGNEDFKERSYQNIREMITHHKNHPSIILWGTRINESADDHDFYLKCSELAVELDDSRQNGGVRNFANSELLEDVYTYNDFSHIGTNPGLENPRKITRGFVPYLVTEHNGHIFPTKSFDPLFKRSEQALRHMNVLESLFKYQRISGAIGWCMSDYNTHKDFGSGDRICHHGVSDMFRIPKYAAYTYASQQDLYPVLEVLSNMNIGEYARSVIPEVVVLTNCDYIKVYHNDKEINTYYSDWDLYPHVNHAPIIIDDFIGKQIEEEDIYVPKIARRIKKLLISYNKHGMNMPFSDKMRMLNLMLFHGFTMGKAMEIYGKYLGNWGKECGVYRFEGYLNDELVITKTAGQTKVFLLKASLDDDTLIHGDTYDATRIVVSLQDEFGNTYPFANNTLDLKCSNTLEIIGPSVVSLSGGSVGIYVKTKSKGKGTIEIRSNGFDPILLNVEIK